MISLKFKQVKANGETCACCKKEIKGKKWIAKVIITNTPPIDLEVNYCEICKTKIDKS